MAHWIADAVLVIVVAVAAVGDLARGRIYNWLTYPAVLAGLAIWSVAGFAAGGWTGGLAGLAWSVAGMLVGFVPMVIAFYLGGIGGGDAKLAAAIGALGRAKLTVYALFYGFLVGGIVAVVVMVRQRVVKRTMGRIWRFTWLLFVGGKPGSPTDQQSPRIATALPWAVGVIWAVVEQRMCHGRTVLDWLAGWMVGR